MKTGLGVRVWLLASLFFPAIAVMGDNQVTCNFDPAPEISMRGTYQEQGYSFEHPYLWHEANGSFGIPNDGMLRRQGDGGTMYIRRIDGIQRRNLGGGIGRCLGLVGLTGLGC